MRGYMADGCGTWDAVQRKTSYASALTFNICNLAVRVLSPCRY